jgi:hypothetical protein
VGSCFKRYMTSREFSPLGGIRYTHLVMLLTENSTGTLESPQGKGLHPARGNNVSVLLRKEPRDIRGPDLEVTTFEAYKFWPSDCRLMLGSTRSFHGGLRKGRTEWRRRFHSLADTYPSYANANANTDADTDADADSYSNARTNTKTFADPNADSYPDTDTYSNANARSYSDAKAHTDANTDADSNANARSYSDAEAHTDAHADTNANTDADSYANANADSYADAYADAHSDIAFSRAYLVRQFIVGSRRLQHLPFTNRVRAIYENRERGGNKLFRHVRDQRKNLLLRVNGGKQFER